ncbi:MAG: hypothetical protein SGCHY_003151 [Lobulomycetales sp.]
MPKQLCKLYLLSVSLLLYMTHAVAEIVKVGAVRSPEIIERIALAKRSVVNTLLDDPESLFIYLGNLGFGGAYARETITFESINASNSRFIEQTLTSGDDFVGLVGMAQFGHPDELLFDKFIEAKVLDENIFSYWINKEMTYAEIIFGGIDPNVIDGELVWVSTTEDWWWTLEFTELTVLSPGTSTVLSRMTFPKKQGLNQEVLFDTGSSVNYMARAEAKTLNEALGFRYARSSVQSGQTDSYETDCANIDQLPDIQFTWGGKQFTVSGRDYVIVFGSSNSPEEMTCVSSILGDPDMPGVVGLVLGNALMHRWYIVHDPGNTRLGFANVKKGAQTAQEVITSPITVSETLTAASSAKLSFNLLVLVTVHAFVKVTVDRVPNLHSRSRENGLSRRDIVPSELADAKDALLIFTGNVSFGTPPQTFAMLYDTGSFTTWVKSSKCAQCTGAVFDGSQSFTYEDTKVSAPTIRYLDGTSVQGNYTIDRVMIENIVVEPDEFRFMEAYTVSDDTLDGIVGMALQGSNEILFDYIRRTGDLDEEVFCYWISEDLTKAEIVFGGVDYSRLNSELSWIPMIEDDYHWAATLGPAFSGNQTIIPFGSPGQRVIFDTGASLNYFSHSDAARLNSFLGFSLSANYPGFYQIDCSQYDSLPELNFTFGEKNFQLRNHDYTLIFGNVNSNGLCLSLFSGTDFGDPNLGMLIGNAMLARWFTVHVQQAARTDDDYGSHTNDDYSKCNSFNHNSTRHHYTTSTTHYNHNSTRHHYTTSTKHYNPGKPPNISVMSSRRQGRPTNRVSGEISLL